VFWDAILPQARSENSEVLEYGVGPCWSQAACVECGESGTESTADGLKSPKSKGEFTQIEELARYVNYLYDTQGKVWSLPLVLVVARQRRAGLGLEANPFLACSLCYSMIFDVNFQCDAPSCGFRGASCDLECVTSLEPGEFLRQCLSRMASRKVWAWRKPMSQKRDVKHPAKYLVLRVVSFPPSQRLLK
jgi:hypothetical protein